VVTFLLFGGIIKQMCVMLIWEESSSGLHIAGLGSYWFNRDRIFGSLRN
jgi:hypothetical protein